MAQRKRRRRKARTRPMKIASEQKISNVLFPTTVLFVCPPRELISSHPVVIFVFVTIVPSKLHTGRGRYQRRTFVLSVAKSRPPLSKYIFKINLLNKSCTHNREPKFADLCFIIVLVGLACDKKKLVKSTKSIGVLTIIKQNSFFLTKST